MIERLPSDEQAWLAQFFASPNDLTWLSLLDGSAPPLVADQVWQWIAFIGSRQGAPLILPYVRGETISAWYATTLGRSGGYELGDEINAWLGPTWLSRFERVPVDSSDPMASVLRGRFGGTVYLFAGSDDIANKAISTRLSQLFDVLARRPIEKRAQVRPVGAIRNDFEKALLAGNAAQAESLIAELKQTGRLNEENLRYLEVRLSAGLGLWSEIALDHWRIKTLADLALPPQVLADLIEALYRNYIDQVEATGDSESVRDVFAQKIMGPYPKLFASRRGIRAQRVVKAFVLYEQLQNKPDPGIINELLSLLPEGSDVSIFRLSPTPQLVPLLPTDLHEADESFDDGQFDRAFEFYFRVSPSKKTINRLVSCVGMIGTEDARDRFLSFFVQVESELVGSLTPAIRAKIEDLSKTPNSLGAISSTSPVSSSVNPWMRWAEQLRTGENLAAAERDVRSAVTNWDAVEIRDDGQLAKKFADILDGLDGEAGMTIKNAIPQLYISFFPDESEVSPTAKPIASLLFNLIAFEEALSRGDLDLLAQLTILRIKMGLSSSEYTSLINDLIDVQNRIGSFSYLPWSLDVCEALAILPCPFDSAHDSRLRLFLKVLGQSAKFAHRLTAVELLPFKMLAKDYEVGEDAVDALKRNSKSGESDGGIKLDLKGKTIGIYTLAESAGIRAKTALEEVFTGCKVVVNSDLVATTQLTSLAKTSDIFVFAWKSSSHQAFYCVKEALGGAIPIWAPGKGTASILRSIFDHLNKQGCNPVVQDV